MTNAELEKIIRNQPGFAICGSSMKHLNEIVDQLVEPELGNPEGIKRVWSEFLDGESGLRKNIVRFFDQQIAEPKLTVCKKLIDHGVIGNIANINDIFQSYLRRAEGYREYAQRHC
jgi:hypothetical protein